MHVEDLPPARCQSHVASQAPFELFFLVHYAPIALHLGLDDLGKGQAPRDCRVRGALSVAAAPHPPHVVFVVAHPKDLHAARGERGVGAGHARFGVDDEGTHIGDVAKEALERGQARSVTLRYEHTPAPHTRSTWNEAR